VAHGQFVHHDDPFIMPVEDLEVVAQLRNTADGVGARP
jgi:hypothetical protein